MQGGGDLLAPVGAGPQVVQQPVGGRMAGRIPATRIDERRLQLGPELAVGVTQVRDALGQHVHGRGEPPGLGQHMTKRQGDRGPAARTGDQLRASVRCSAARSGAWPTSMRPSSSSTSALAPRSRTSARARSRYWMAVPGAPRRRASAAASRSEPAAHPRPTRWPSPRSRARFPAGAPRCPGPAAAARPASGPPARADAGGSAPPCPGRRPRGPAGGRTPAHPAGDQPLGDHRLERAQRGRRVHLRQLGHPRDRRARPEHRDGPGHGQGAGACGRAGAGPGGTPRPGSSGGHARRPVPAARAVGGQAVGQRPEQKRVAARHLLAGRGERGGRGAPSTSQSSRAQARSPSGSGWITPTAGSSRRLPSSRARSCDDRTGRAEAISSTGRPSRRRARCVAKLRLGRSAQCRSSMSSSSGDVRARSAVSQYSPCRIANSSSRCRPGAAPASPRPSAGAARRPASRSSRRGPSAASSRTISSKTCRTTPHG